MRKRPSETQNIIVKNPSEVSLDKDVKVGAGLHTYAPGRNSQMRQTKQTRISTKDSQESLDGRAGSLLHRRSDINTILNIETGNQSMATDYIAMSQLQVPN